MTNTELMTYRRQLLALQSRLNTDVHPVHRQEAAQHEAAACQQHDLG